MKQSERLSVLFTGLMVLCWGGALGFWWWGGEGGRGTAAAVVVGLSYLGLLLGVGIGGYVTAAPRQRPAVRATVIALVGGPLLVAALLTDHGNMQPGGLVAALLTGTGGYIVLHYGLAKLVGPMLVGRVWCGWACWYAMFFDQLPYPQSRFRREHGDLRRSHLLVIVGIAGGLWWGWRLNLAESGAGFVGGLGVFLLVGLVLALVMRDNRAFCKHLCPIAPMMRPAARLSVVKLSGTADHCVGCEACVERCPMNIRVKDYLLAGERVLSTECTLCLTCISTCPHDAIHLSLGLDVGGRERLDRVPPAARAPSL